MDYVQQSDNKRFSEEREFLIIPCNLCGSQMNLSRVKVKSMLAKMTQDNPKVPSSMLRVLQNIKPSQLMDKALWDFDA